MITTFISGTVGFRPICNNIFCHEIHISKSSLIAVATKKDRKNKQQFLNSSEQLKKKIGPKWYMYSSLSHAQILTWLLHFQYGKGCGGRKRDNKIHNFLFLNLTLKCYVDIRAQAWVVECHTGQGHIWCAEWLNLPHEKLAGCCKVPKAMPATGVLIPRAPLCCILPICYLSSYITWYSRNIHSCIAETPQIHTLEKKKHKYKYIPAKSTYNHLPN